MTTRTRTIAAAIAVAASVTGTALLGASGAASAATGAAHGTLTVSNGTRYVLIGGHRVDFAVPVRDLAWSPDGAKAAFIDGSGNLDVASANGSGRVVVAKNPGDQNWSHPTWQVTAKDTQNGIPAKDNLIFAARDKGVSRLKYISAKAVHGTPKTLSLNGDPGPGGAIPQTGNVWPNAGGHYGSSVYANVDTGAVYIRDDYLRQQGSRLTQGSEPALSPNEEEVVFVRSVAGHDHVLVEDFMHRNHITDLTPHATADYTEPAWSPDGKTLAVRTPSGTVTLASDGTGHPVKVTSTTGLAAYRP
ncbi:PD40 domain-containing protein [Streptomyces sp. FXJ1.172]|uniref:PD40 domain-containing protein n=1 Tax=Streptomyces sp. FXJ1.172 TaxID=710705 RepID=UPI0007CFB1E2|nr:PD40 domain-containing protein [Streptomyces sp. FXJ1.172]WEO99481.1 PD40 domain-containing protein [Streptomyces sp. FXJ1.172]